MKTGFLLIRAYSLSSLYVSKYYSYHNGKSGSYSVGRATCVCDVVCSFQTVLSSLNANDGSRTGLTIDWVGRRLYWAVNTPNNNSRIAVFDQALQQEDTLTVRSHVIHCVQADPITK